MSHDVAFSVYIMFEGSPALDGLASQRCKLASTSEIRDLNEAIMGIRRENGTVGMPLQYLLKRGNVGDLEPALKDLDKPLAEFVDAARKITVICKPAQSAPIAADGAMLSGHKRARCGAGDVPEADKSAKLLKAADEKLPTAQAFDPSAAQRFDIHRAEPASCVSEYSCVETEERLAFKKSVAEFYGMEMKLKRSGKIRRLQDMLGNFNKRSDTQLALIYPLCYEKYNEFGAYLNLPDRYWENPRTYLLLPEDVHRAYDRGQIAFIPSRDGTVTIKVLKRGMETPFEDFEDIMELHNTKLVIPNAAKGNVPFLSELAWMGWCAYIAANFRVPAEGAAPTQADGGCYSRAIDYLDPASVVRQVRRT